MNTVARSMALEWFCHLQSIGIPNRAIQFEMAKLSGRSITELGIMTLTDEELFSFACVLWNLSKNLHNAHTCLLSFSIIGETSKSQWEEHLVSRFEATPVEAERFCEVFQNAHVRDIALQPLKRWAASAKLMDILPVIIRLLQDGHEQSALKLRDEYHRVGTFGQFEHDLVKNMMIRCGLPGRQRLLLAHLIPDVAGDVVWLCMRMWVMDCAKQSAEVFGDHLERDKEKFRQFPLILYNPVPLYPPRDAIKRTLPNRSMKTLHIVDDVIQSTIPHLNNRQLGRWALLFAFHFREIPAYVVLEIVKASGFYNWQTNDKQFVQFVQNCKNSVDKTLRLRNCTAPAPGCQ